MVQKLRILPWSIKHPPSNYEMYCLAKAWNATELTKYIVDYIEGKQPKD